MQVHQFVACLHYVNSAKAKKRNNIELSLTYCWMSFICSCLFIVDTCQCPTHFSQFRTARDEESFFLVFLVSAFQLNCLTGGTKFDSKL